MISPSGQNLTFLLGLPRSGTTLLSAMLNNHPQLHCPPEPWIMLGLDALGKVDAAHPADSQLLGDGVREFLQNGGGIEAARQYAHSIYNSKLNSIGKSHFIDKTPRYHLILNTLIDLFPDSRFIYLRRNPFDVAASFKTSWLLDIPQFLRTDLAHRAVIDLILAPRNLEKFAQQPRVHTLSYETLVADPANEVARVVQFLGFEPVGDMTQFDLTDSAHAKSFMGDRKVLSTKAPHKDSLNKWASVFSPEDQQILLDAIGVQTLRDRGYSELADQLLASGLHDSGPEVTADYVQKVEVGLAQRWGHVHGVSTYKGEQASISQAQNATADLAENPYLTLFKHTNQLQAELAQLKSAHDETLTQTRTSLESQISQLQQHTAALENHRNMLQDEKTRLADELSQKLSTETLSAQQLADRDQRLQTLESQLASAQEELNKAAADLTAKASRLAEVEQSLSGRSAEVAKTHELLMRTMNDRQLLAEQMEIRTQRPIAKIVPPDRKTSMERGAKHRSSWTGHETYVSYEHENIWSAAKDLPGWQDPQDSEKLYEMAYFNGEVILEIGIFGGRSAFIELTGALTKARQTGAPLPQYYGIDPDPTSMHRAMHTLFSTGVTDRALLYEGILSTFVKDIPIVPTMVFVDGDHTYGGVVADLETLRNFVAPGTPLLCHDYGGIDGVRQAIDEAVATGYYEAMGVFAGAILLKATDKCKGVPRKLTEATFARVRQSLHDIYSKKSSTESINVEDRDAATLPARQELLAERHAPTGYGTWPYEKARSAPLPATLPDGSNWPKISIVTPTRNQGKYIEETILSVLNQDYPNVEYIIIDGASTDQTVSIVEKYKHRLAYFVSEPDKGQSNAINKGLSRATGEIVTWLNSDDMLEPGALAAMAMGFHTSGADMVAGICNVHSDRTIYDRHLTSCADGPLPLHDLLDLDGNWMKGQFFYQPEVMFKRELWLRAGGYVDEALYYSMDYELWCRFAQVGAKVHAIARSIVLFRAHEEQKTSGGKFETELRKVRDDFVIKHNITLQERGPVPTKSQMRLVYFSDLGNVAGAGVAHQRMASAARQAGHEVTHLAIAPHLVNPSPNEEEVLAAIDELKPDVVVAGNVHGASMEPSMIGKIAERWPTVQVLHDLWSITGRCAYNRDCDKYIEGCDSSCPTQNEYPVVEPSKIKVMWEKKQEIFTGSHPPILAGVSQWVQGMIEKRFSLSEKKPPMTYIRCGMPLEYFKPRDRATCRELLGLPQDKFIVMFSSSQLSDERKGLKDLLDALDSLKLPNVMAVCVGHLGVERLPSGLEIHSLGYVNQPQRLAMVYSAADIFVGPSKIETFGQVFIEAAACGTPSVAYAVGGVPESLADGLSGFVAQKVESSALAEAIKKLYGDAELRQKMAVWGRLWVENEWSLEAAFHRLFSMLHREGVLRKVGVVPHISLKKDFLGLIEPSYFVDKIAAKNPASAPAAAPVATPAPAEELPLLQQVSSTDVNIIKNERDELKRTLDRIQSTKLWTSIEWTRETFANMIHSKYMPHFLSKQLLKMGRWGAGGLERTGAIVPPSNGDPRPKDL